MVPSNRFLASPNRNNNSVWQSHDKSKQQSFKSKSSNTSICSLSTGNPKQRNLGDSALKEILYPQTYSHYRSISPDQLDETVEMKRMSLYSHNFKRIQFDTGNNSLNLTTMKILLSNTLCLLVGLPIAESVTRSRTGRISNDVDFEAATASWKHFQQQNPSGLIQEVEQAEAAIEQEEEALSELMEVIVEFEPLSMLPLLPSAEPSISVKPSVKPSLSVEPSLQPSISVEPSLNPTSAPSISTKPSVSVEPSVEPTNGPTVSTMPSLSPTSTIGEPLEPEPSSIPSLSPTQSVAPSEFPTLSNCDGRTPEERALAILEVLDQVADPDAIRDISTPQGRATEWIIDEDARRLCPTDDPKPIVQRWSLAVMYYNTGGDLWFQCFAGAIPLSSECGLLLPHIDEDPFLSPSSECEWAGITCNFDACVTEIEFEDNNLVGTIPTEMGLLTDLVVLGMEQGVLQGSVPSELGELTDLNFLDLDFNFLSGTLPTELWQLTELRTLDLDNNLISGGIDGIGALTQLEFVQMHINFFSGTVPDGLGNALNLATFNLHENNFVGSMPSSVCLLRDRFLTSLIADCAGNPPQIECTCCSDCRV